MALAGKGADIYLASGAPNAVTGAAMTAISVAAGALNGEVITSTQWYRPTTQARRFADPAVAPVVYVDAAPAAAADYTFDPAGGIVKFLVDTPGTITMDYSYLTIAQCGGAHEWSLGLEQEIADVSVFGNSWKSKLPVGELQGNVSLSRWWIDERFQAWLAQDTSVLMTNVNPGPKILLSLYTSFASNLRYECMGTIKGDSVKAAQAGTVDEEINIESEGTITYADWT